MSRQGESSHCSTQRSPDLSKTRNYIVRYTKLIAVQRFTLQKFDVDAIYLLQHHCINYRHYWHNFIFSVHSSITPPYDVKCIVLCKVKRKLSFSLVIDLLSKSGLPSAYEDSEKLAELLENCWLKLRYPSL